MLRLCLFSIPLSSFTPLPSLIFMCEVCTWNRQVLYMHYSSFMGLNFYFLWPSRNALMLHAFKIHELYFHHTVYSCILCDSYNKQAAILPQLFFVIETQFSPWRGDVFRLARIVAKSAHYLHHVRPSPSARVIPRGSHWTDFHQIWYWKLTWEPI